MTNEEAIMILKAMIDEMILVFDRDRKKALNMAISALAAQIPERTQQESNVHIAYVCPNCGSVQCGGDGG